MVPVGVVAVAGAVVVTGARALRRRRRRAAAGWANGRYPSRDELAARRRERENTFAEGVEFSMGRTRERSPGGLDRWSPIDR
ncbi:hypothetical protein [Actinomarinicola tropica]|uniref:Uncharacterized protein n=1 Tax=Actinomarinicola tropica TaxID=2789776 RepID=A0A5Q2RMC7_9ACTN|nr:hypothetical protein [Actinomarinicola tropica]QGG94335.1 hypothetical protein GH723_04030 [Actinomarinicola tropica]